MQAQLRHLLTLMVDLKRHINYERLRKSLDTVESTADLDGVCTQCLDSSRLSKDSHSGSELKKRKKRYPNYKIKDRAYYRNLVAKNAWICGNVFDPMGKYLFCYTCLQLA